jgi:hypothetical protein
LPNCFTFSSCFGYSGVTVLVDNPGWDFGTLNKFSNRRKKSSTEKKLAHRGGLFVFLPVVFLPARKALASLPVSISVQVMRVARLVALEKPLGFRLGVEVRAVTVLNARLAWPRGAVSPLPRGHWTGLRPKSPTGAPGLFLQAGVFSLVRGVLPVVPRQAVSNEQGSEVPATGFNACYSAAVAADLFDGDPDVFSADVSPSGPRGGPAIGLGGFGRVDSVETDRNLPANRPTHVVSVPVGDLYDPAREGLAGFYGSVSLPGLCRVWGGDSDKEKRGQKSGLQESGLEESGHVRDGGANVSVGMDLFSLSLPIQCTGPITLLFFQVT